MVATKNFRSRPGLRTALRAIPHPSHRRGFPYAVHFREAALYFDDSQPIRNNPAMIVAREVRIRESARSTRRWRRRLARLGHLRPFRRTGNKRATVLRGYDAYRLAVYRTTYPKATIAEINAYLYIVTGRFYDPSQISRCEDRLGLSRKRGSTTAYQALHPRNVAWRWAYHNLPYPFGIADIQRRDIIDLDEMGIFLETVNRGDGKSYIGCLLYTSPSPRDLSTSRMPSSA